MNSKEKSELGGETGNFAGNLKNINGLENLSKEELIQFIASSAIFKQGIQQPTVHSKQRNYGIPQIKKTTDESPIATTFNSEINHSAIQDKEEIRLNSLSPENINLSKPQISKTEEIGLSEINEYTNEFSTQIKSKKCEDLLNNKELGVDDILQSRMLSQGSSQQSSIEKFYKPEELQEIQDRFCKNYANISIREITPEAGVFERMQFDIYKRMTKEDRLQIYMESKKQKIPKRALDHTFQRLIKDGQRREEKIQVISKQKELENVNKENQGKKINREESDRIYQGFMTRLQNKQKLINEKKKIIQFREEVDYLNNLADSKNKGIMSSNEVSQLVDRMQKDIANRKTKIEIKRMQMEEKTKEEVNTMFQPDIKKSMNSVHAQPHSLQNVSVYKRMEKDVERRYMKAPFPNDYDSLPKRAKSPNIKCSHNKKWSMGGIREIKSNNNSRSHSRGGSFNLKESADTGLNDREEIKREIDILNDENSGLINLTAPNNLEEIEHPPPDELIKNDLKALEIWETIDQMLTKEHPFQELNTNPLSMFQTPENTQTKVRMPQAPTNIITNNQSQNSKSTKPNSAIPQRNSQQISTEASYLKRQEFEKILQDSFDRMGQKIMKGYREKGREGISRGTSAGRSGAKSSQSSIRGQREKEGSPKVKWGKGRVRAANKGALSAQTSPKGGRGVIIDCSHEVGVINFDAVSPIVGDRLLPGEIHRIDVDSKYNPPQMSNNGGVRTNITNTTHTVNTINTTNRNMRGKTRTNTRGVKYPGKEFMVGDEAAKLVDQLYSKAGLMNKRK